MKQGTVEKIMRCNFYFEVTATKKPQLQRRFSYEEDSEELIQRRFREVEDSGNVLLPMIEKWRKPLDEGAAFGALLTDLS